MAKPVETDRGLRQLGPFGFGVDGPRGTGPNPSMKSQLYSLENDPFEPFNLIDREPDVTTVLQQRLERYQDQGQSVTR